MLSDGVSGYGIYDAVQSSTNRAARPFFATDSRYTLTQWTRLRAMSLARWAYPNVHFVRGAVDLNARLTVGTGFSCKSLSSNPGWNLLADRYVEDKLRNIGFTNGESMDELLIHDSRACDIDGDIGYVMCEDEYGEARLQLIEGHRIKSGSVSDPRLIDGVWFDNYGRRVAYNVAIPAGGLEPTQRVEAQSFIYLAERNRPDEPRSISNLIHALSPLQDLYEIMAFEMQSVKKNSEIGLTIETPTPDRPPLGPPVNIFGSGAIAVSGTQPASPAQYITREQIYGSGGKVVVLKTGEKLEAHNHTRPSPGLPEWVEFVIRGIGVGFGLPFEVLWNPEAIGGANTRLITALVRARLQQRRETLIFPKLRRVRYWLLARAIKRGELPPNPEMTLCQFQPKFTDITVDAGRESAERRANVLQGLDTFTSYFAENGETYKTQLATREDEIIDQCMAAERLMTRFPHLTFEAALARIALLTPNASETTVGESNPNRQPPPK